MLDMFFSFQIKRQLRPTNHLRLNQVYNHLLLQIFQIILAGSLINLLLSEDVVVLKVQIKNQLMNQNTMLTHQMLNNLKKMHLTLVLTQTLMNANKL